MAISAGKPIIEEHEEIAGALEVLRSGRLVKGKVTEMFEEAFAAQVGAAHAVAVNNGTTALQAALLAHGIGPGDEVITTPWTFIATANMILAVGATPAFCDIDPGTYCLDPNQVEMRVKASHGKVKAILPVHLYGHPANMDEFHRLADDYELVLIGDGAQAHGATWNGEPIGAQETTTWSFFPSKNAHAGGEGGMVTTSNGQVAHQLRLLRNHGRVDTYDHQEMGYNWRLPEICAAVALAQVRKLPEMNAKRKANAAFLTGSLKTADGLIVPMVDPRAGHVYHQYTIRVSKNGGFPLTRDEFRAYMKDLDIECPVHYPIPVHMQTAYRRIREWGQFPLAEQAAAQVISLPVHPSLTRDDLQTIVNAISNVYQLQSCS